VGERAFKVLIGAAIVLAAFAAPAGASESTAQQTLTVVPKLEEAIVAEVNVVRRRRGLRPLRSARGLETAATRHTVSMLQRGVFAHEIPGGPRFAARLRRHYTPRSRGWSVAENLAAAWPEPTARETVRMWLASPPHRRNLLSPLWREIGVAAIHAPSAPGDFGDSEITLVTADFGVRG
jgi:uncharacterized protein YkwD